MVMDIDYIKSLQSKYTEFPIEFRNLVKRIQSEEYGSYLPIKTAWRKQNVKVKPTKIIKGDKKPIDIIAMEVRGLLNKISESNLDKITSDLKMVKITTSEEFNMYVSLIIEKAIVEPTYGKIYAKLCQGLMMCVVEINNVKIKFIDLLLFKTKTTFEELLSYTEVSDPRHKNRIWGAITFLAELYKSNILNNKIIHICLTSLVQNITRPATIESLLIFIKTLGKDFFVREARHGNNTEKYFIKIEESLDNEKISKRYKFTLRDILDLKKEWEI